MESTLRLFKALPVQIPGKLAKDRRVELLNETLPKGFVFDDKAAAYYSDTAHVIDLVNKAFGRDARQLNQSFHKSWAKVKHAPTEQLILEQLVHYFTTYGAESLGFYDKDAVFVPNEQLDIPAVTEDIKLVVIHGYTKDELKAKLLELLSTGVALSEQTVTDVMDIATFVGVTEDDVEQVKNKEVKAALYDYFGIVPENPVEFLRYAVYRATNKTLLIKNGATVAAIKERDNLDVTRYFDTYEKEYGLPRLAEIFYRYKPIFLAFRTNTKLKKTINKIRRYANTNHKPMKEDVLNSITSRLQEGKPLTGKQFYDALDNANVFRKIRLAYALKFRTTDADSILYRVRNGKSFAKEFSFENKKGAQTILDEVVKSIVKGIAPSVQGKKVYIPEHVKYALPATEKQFTGEIPSGSYVEVQDDMVAGIHWENQGSNRIDLDLSLTSVDGKIGWDRSYRNAERNVLFSGDVTDAPLPDGASEFFYVNQENRGVYNMFLNYYNFDESVPVPYKIMIAHEKPRNGMNSNYMVDPNNVVAITNTVIDVHQKSLGLLVADEKSTRFYFAESELGRQRSVGNAAYVEQTRNYLLNYYTDSIVLNDILEAAGAEIVTAAGQEIDLDLSPESIDKTTVINLLTGSQENAT